MSLKTKLKKTINKSLSKNVTVKFQLISDERKSLKIPEGHCVQGIGNSYHQIFQSMRSKILWNSLLYELIF